MDDKNKLAYIKYGVSFNELFLGQQLEIIKFLKP